LSNRRKYPHGATSVAIRQRPVSGVGERLVTNGRSQRQASAHHFRPKAGAVAWFGVYDVWKGDGERAITLAIVTTDGSTERRAVSQPHAGRARGLTIYDWMRSTPTRPRR